MWKLSLAFLVAGIIGLGSGNALAASDSHSHDASHSELMLNNGQKWPTDGALRKGMMEIRALMAEALPKAHTGRMDAEGYSKLSGRIVAQIDYLTANCRLPTDADAQLHLVLAEIIDGAEHMKKGKSPVEGVVKVIKGVDVYGKYFDHTGWQPLDH